MPAAKEGAEVGRKRKTEGKPDWAGQDWTEAENTGYHKTGRDKAEQDKTTQNRTGCSLHKRGDSWRKKGTGGNGTPLRKR